MRVSVCIPVLAVRIQVGGSTFLDSQGTFVSCFVRSNYVKAIWHTWQMTPVTVCGMDGGGEGGGRLERCWLVAADAGGDVEIASQSVTFLPSPHLRLKHICEQAGRHLNNGGHSDIQMNSNPLCYR